MNDRQSRCLVLARGESQALRVKAGTVVLVISGQVVLHGPPQWLAERLVAVRQWLDSEQRYTVIDGGWIDLVAGERAEVLLLPPETGYLRQWMANCLSRLFGRHRNKTASQPISD